MAARKNQTPRDVNLLDSGWDLTADDRNIAAKSGTQESETWVGSDYVMRNDANEAGTTSARFNGGKIDVGLTEQFQRPELEIGPYVSADPVVSKPVDYLFSDGDNTSGNSLQGHQALGISNLTGTTCGDKSLRMRVNSARSEVELGLNKNSEFYSMKCDKYDVFDITGNSLENDREQIYSESDLKTTVRKSDRSACEEATLTSSDISYNSNYADLLMLEQNETHPKRQLLSVDMEKDDVSVDFVGRSEVVNGTCCELQSESTRTDQSYWHCHNKQPEERDNLARNQLIAVCTLCGTFMIGEAVGGKWDTQHIFEDLKSLCHDHHLSIILNNSCYHYSSRTVPGGVLSNSLALFTDVLHLASDLISFLISLLAIYLSTKPATKTMSFGYYRAEVLGALFSVFIIWLVTGVLCYMAAERIMHKHYVDVKSDEMLITASLGVVFNIIMGIVLHSEKCCGSAQGKFGHGHSHSHGSPSHRPSHGASVPQDQHEHVYQPLLENGSIHEMQSPLDDQEFDRPRRRHKNINVRAAFIHVIGDIIQSVGVLIASLIIKFKPEEEYKLADPICTFLFSVLVILTTVTVFRDTLRVMMEGVPHDLNYSVIVADLQKIEGVIMVHSLCMWCLTIDKNALSVHLAIDDNQHHQKILEKASVCLKENHNFFHTTIQVENFVPALMSNCDKCKGPKC